MSNIRVNVGAPDEIPVPNTGAYTSISDTTVSGNNTFYIGIGAVIALALVIILPILLVRKGVFKKPVSGFSLSSKKKLLPRFLALAVLTFGLTFSVLGVLKNNANRTNALESSPEDILTITTEDIDIDSMTLNSDINKTPLYGLIAPRVTGSEGNSKRDPRLPLCRRGERDTWIEGIRTADQASDLIRA